MRSILIPLTLTVMLVADCAHNVAAISNPADSDSARYAVRDSALRVMFAAKPDTTDTARLITRAEADRLIVHSSRTLILMAGATIASAIIVHAIFH